MRWSLPLGRVFGIRIAVHLSFLLLLGWIAWLGWRLGGVHASLWALLLINFLFVCVVLHELGHSLVAMRFGVEVRSITLLPIGGLASMQHIPERPSQEFLISVAGPLVNVVIAAGMTLLRGGFPDWHSMPVLPASWQDLRDMLILTNVVLVVFNLVPAFPMDGGRIFRSLLAMMVPFARATAMATVLGQVLAVGFVLLGLFHGNPVLALIGLFVFFSAEGEDRRVRLRAALGRVQARDVMLTDFASVSPTDSLQRCLEYVYHHRQEDFPVTMDGMLVGILPRKAWLSVLHREGVTARVGDVMTTRFLSVRPASDLGQAYGELLSLDQGVFPVVDEGRVVGLLTLEDIHRYLRVQQARGARRRTGSAGIGAGSAASRFTVDLG